MNHRQRIITALRHLEPDRIPIAIHFAPAKYEEFIERTGQTDPYEYFNLDYRHVPVITPNSLLDFSPYFVGRVPDWPNVESDDVTIQAGPFTPM